MKGLQQTFEVVSAVLEVVEVVVLEVVADPL